MIVSSMPQLSACDAKVCRIRCGYSGRSMPIRLPSLEIIFSMPRSVSGSYGALLLEKSASPPLRSAM